METLPLPQGPEVVPDPSYCADHSRSIPVLK
jgi:hypothetical protein